MLPLGTPAPDFALRDTENKLVRRDDFHGAPGLLVIFKSNHCPYVKHIAPKLAELTTAFLARGLAVVAINSNDVEKYPDDSPEKMREEVKLRSYRFPYLFDADQTVAMSYQAACTPEFYLFDAGHKLVYRGQFDDSRPGSDKPVTGKDLKDAVDALLAGKSPSPDQKPSVGCNIKWKPGHEPRYFARP